MSHRDYEGDDEVDESPESIAADELKEKERIKKIREKHSIPDGVYLMGGCAINDKDIAPFMQFAKWWVKGQWTDEIANLFLFHYCEIVEVDFYWVLMDDPANYCGLGIEGCIDENNEEWRNECGYIRLEPELKRIGMRSRKKAIINFELYIGHGWHKNN